MYKRKHPGKSKRDDDWEQASHVQSGENVDSPVLDPCLYVQAHEADVVHGPSAASARFLEFRDSSVVTTSSSGSRSGLIPWGLPRPTDADSTDTRQSNQPVLWVDRYDVRLLLDHLPESRSESTRARPLSPSGWSDLPSDSEDTFFFSPDELEDYRREKRRKLINRGREERLRALATIDGQEEELDPWGGSDEEPDQVQLELIRRTASHIISSPNPAQLEMRILANHGTDKRFAFLRGRWSRVWRTERERARQNQTEEAEKKQTLTVASLGGLAGYGDSDSDGEGSADEKPQDGADTSYDQDGPSSEDAVREARRARARAWSARRRAEQSESQSSAALKSSAT